MIQKSILLFILFFALANCKTEPDFVSKITAKNINITDSLETVATIDSFVKSFLESDGENHFAVFEKKTYYWNQNGESLTDWKGMTSMNTKFVDAVYEAAHCLYASRIDIIGEGFWMNKHYPPKLDLFKMEELESFDIDYPWQFEVAEKLYKTFFQNN